MYEQISHSLLNSILDDLKPEIRRQDLLHFYTRLGANFYAIHSLFYTLYRHRDDFKLQMLRLVETMAKGYIDRSPELERLDIQREQDHNWFLSQKWVGDGSLFQWICRQFTGSREQNQLFSRIRYQYGAYYADFEMS